MDQGEAMEVLLKRFVIPTPTPTRKISGPSLEKGSTLMALPELQSSINPNGIELSSTENKRKCEASNFLKIYFDFAFYVCCSPFHVVTDRNGWFLVKTFKPQQVLCAVLHLLGILRLITEIRGSIPEVLSQSPEEYFAVAGGGFRLLFKIISMKRLWCNQKQFLDIMNFTVMEKTLPCSQSKLQHKYFVSTVCLICTVMPIAIGCSNSIATPTYSWDASWNRTGLVSDGRFAFFLINRSEYIRRTSSQSIVLREDINSFDYFAAVLLGIGLLERLLIGFYFDTCLLFAVLTLWCTSHALARDLQDNDHTSSGGWTNLSSSSGKGCSPKETVKWTDLYNSYKGIRFLSHLINSAFGSMTTLYVGESILYHSMNLDAVVLTRNIFKQMHLLFFAISSSLTFLFSADICSQMDTLKIWLAKDDNRRAVPLDELNIVLHELNTRMIGIGNIFKITYSLVWNMLTTVVTYFIICVQSRGNSSKITGQL